MSKLKNIIGVQGITITVILTFLSAGSATLSVLSPFWLKEVIKFLTDEGGLTVLKPFLNTCIVLLSFFTGKLLLCDIPYCILSTYLDQTNGTKLRQQVFEKFKKLPYTYFQKSTIGHNMTVILHDCSTISSNLVGSIVQTFSAFFLFISIVVTMLVISWKLAIVSIIAIPLIGLFIPFITKKTKNAYQKRWPTLSKLSADIEEKFSNTLFIRSSGKENKINNEFDKINKELYYLNKKTNFIASFSGPFFSIIYYLSIISVCIIAAVISSASGDKTEIYAIPSFLLLIGMFNSPFTTFSNSIANLTNSFVCLNRIQEIINQPNEQTTILQAPVFNSEMTVEYKHVTFSYNGKKNTLKDINFIAKKGEKIAIVGHTGSGKTTIVDLLMKFYTVEDGSIEIGGVNINKINNELLRTMFSIIPQEPWFFKGTIKENLVYNNTHLTDSQIEEACKKTDALHFILAQKDGFNTLMDNNLSISAGEKQLLAITRQVLADRHFVIMDEATSNVDTQTEKKIQNAIEGLKTDKTMFVIAHRLSTIRDANKIIVLKEGEIAEMGNHDELISKKGLYFEMYISQFVGCD